MKILLDADEGRGRAVMEVKVDEREGSALKTNNPIRDFPLRVQMLIWDSRRRPLNFRSTVIAPVFNKGFTHFTVCALIYTLRVTMASGLSLMFAPNNFWTKQASV